VDLMPPLPPSQCDSVCEAFLGRAVDVHKVYQQLVSCPTACMPNPVILVSIHRSRRTVQMVRRRAQGLPAAGEVPTACMPNQVVWCAYS
jgi:hypothetical protein